MNGLRCCALVLKSYHMGQGLEIVVLTVKMHSDHLGNFSPHL